MDARHKRKCVLDLDHVQALLTEAAGGLVHAPFWGGGGIPTEPGATWCGTGRINS